MNRQTRDRDNPYVCKHIVTKYSTPAVCQTKSSANLALLPHDVKSDEMITNSVFGAPATADSDLAIVALRH